MIRRLALLAMALAACLPASLQANWCAIPGSAGSPTSLSGVVNSYYPGNASVAVNATSITLGAATGAGQAIAAGDLLLVIQMQDALIDTRNNSRYGDGASGGYGSGYSDIQQTGRYEYVRATNSVSAAGGTLNLVGGAGAGLVYQYRRTAASNTGAKASFQVVKVPQYNNATVTGAVLASAWDGSSGGIVAIDVAGRLTFSGGSLSASGRGFRGGGARDQDAGSGLNTDYRTSAAINANGAKGEGIAGTPRYVANGATLQDIGVEGYADGSNGRGAPGNAGGGGTDGNPTGNDQNSGGGGGGNGGAGGLGGHSWCPTAPTGCPQSGGHPGSAVADNGVSRVVMGGGGGAGSTNNATGTAGAFSSSGAAGGGIVMVRAAEIAGAALVYADGADANSSVDNDGTGGGGAGGSVLVSALRLVTGASLTVSAAGGDGGSNSGGGAAHGPGGGGGGGFVATSIASSNSVPGGTAGTTVNGGTYGTAYGALAGNGGAGITIAGANIPGLSSGGECTPTIVKSFSVSPVTPGATTRLNIAVTNNNPTTALTNLAFTDTYPAGLVNAASPAASKSCATAGTLAATANGGTFAVTAATINAGLSCTYSVNTTVTSSGNKTNTIAAGALTGRYGTTYSVASLADASAIVQVSPPLTVLKSSQAYFDPVNGTTSAKLIPGGAVAYTITVSNPATYTVDTNSVIVIDATPANLQLYVNDVGGAGTGPVIFTNGVPASGLTYSFAGLASGADNIDFSNNGGTSWTYTPVANASGTDPAVTHIRIRPQGAMAAGSSFTLQLGYVIN